MRAAMSLGRLSFAGVALAILACGCGPSYTSSPLAAVGENESAAFVGRYFGGGTHFGRGRRFGEATWGRDYAGLDFLKLIELRMAAPPESNPQGGIGSY